MRVPLISAFVVGLFATTSASAIGQIPDEIRAKMDGYVGSWSYDEMTRDGPSATERSATGTWEARWFSDTLIQWTWTGNSPGGPVSGVEFEGYDPIRQGYTFSFASDGSRGESYDAEWVGNTLRIQFIEYTADGDVSRGRCTWPYSDDFTELEAYSCERLTNGRWWVFRRGSARKTGR